MYAVVESQGKQYKVSVGQEVLVDLLPSAPGSVLDLDRILLLRSPEKGTLVGSPVVEGAAVQARILGREKGPKIVAYKLRRRKNSRTAKGHRQGYTRLKILKIQAPAAWA